MITLPQLKSGIEDKNMCTTCGGACCKNMPGGVIPDDLRGLSTELLVSMLRSGDYAVDWWEGDPREGKDELLQAYFIRPAVVGFEGVLLHPSWRGRCVLLTPTGCKLNFNSRPAECRHLKPDLHSAHGCTSQGGVTKQSIAIKWIPYHKIILDAVGIIQRERVGGTQ